MNLARVAAIAAREVAAITKSRAVWLPMALVPFVMFIALPLIVTLVAHAVTDEKLASELREMLALMPKELVATLPHDRPSAAFVELMLRQVLTPMFIIVPLMTATLVAANAFAGERERRTLEALLHTPATDLEVFAGKSLGAFLPALVTCVAGLVIVSVVADVSAWSIVGRLLLPDALWLAMALVLAPAMSGLAIIALVFVSARVRGFQEASQLGGLLVLPIVAVVVGQVTGVMYLRAWLVLLIGFIVLAIDVALVVVVGRAFRRDDLFTRM